MRNKKLVSTVVASALVATTMAMPVMAADGGNLPVDVSTKTAVIRVAVPTKLEVSVNQFEMGDDGSQIYSGDFTMDNKSEIPVKVSVTSTADLKATTKLVGTKEAASTSTTAGEVWMAVAAKTGASSYADGTATATKDLTEANRNVETFVQGTDANAAKGTAAQTFYLSKSSNMAYKLLNANEDASKIEYAKFYELTAETVADANALSALLADNDVYVAPAAAANGQSLTKVAKGDSHTYASGEVYYTADFTTVTEKADIEANKLYVYGDGAADATAATSGSAAFRYIGKLSGEQEKWDDTDITTVTIKYDIVGVTGTKYDDVKTACVYGLYKDPAPATSSVPATVTIPASGDITIPVTLGSDNADLTKLETVAYAGDMLTMGDGYGATYASGNITLGADIAAYLRGASEDDLNTVTFTATFGSGENAYTQTFKFTK